jgi:hypothetical protein
MASSTSGDNEKNSILDEFPTEKYDFYMGG